MANSAQATKRAHQAEQRRQRNTSQKSAMRTHLKRVQQAIDAKDKEAATTAYNEAVPVIDRSAGKGLIHKNQAARHKSRLHSAVRALTG